MTVTGVRAADRKTLSYSLRQIEDSLQPHTAMSGEAVDQLREFVSAERAIAEAAEQKRERHAHAGEGRPPAECGMSHPMTDCSVPATSGGPAERALRAARKIRAKLFDLSSQPYEPFTDETVARIIEAEAPHESEAEAKLDAQFEREKKLVAALKRTLSALKGTLSSVPVRDADETISEAESLLREMGEM